MPMGVSEQRRQSPELRNSKFGSTVEYGEKNYSGARILTPQTAADLLLIFLCENGEAMHKKSDGKAVQGAQRLMLVCFVMHAAPLNNIALLTP
jgi:hypothetical protein